MPNYSLSQPYMPLNGPSFGFPSRSFEFPSNIFGICALGQQLSSRVLYLTRSDTIDPVVKRRCVAGLIGAQVGRLA